MKNFYTDRLRTGYIPPGLFPARQVLKRFASFRGRLVLSLAALLVCGMTWGQAPERISHQAVVRDMSDNLVASQAVGVRITILQGAPNGANMYREQHSLTTNAAGLLSLEIGSGAVQNGSLSAINWNMGPYFVEQAIDPSGGTNYTISETTQLLSVPYALYAQSADRANSATRADVATGLSTAGGQFGVPIGMVVPYSGPAGSVPTGWLLCDGASYDVNIYPELFALIGTAYGSDPNRFKVPDLRGRGPMGRDANQAEFAALGQIGGAKTHTLTIAEMPAHNHGGVTGSAGNHSHIYGTRGFLTSVTGSTTSGLGMDGSFDDQNAVTQPAGEHPHPIPSQGAGSPHNNLQPYLTLNFIIKAR
jgi:microcystin-dependent protein